MIRGTRAASRLEETFTRLRSRSQVGLVTFATVGDPDLERSAAIFQALDGAGADVIEVGVPFSDPLADGPVIQRASERALAAGATLSSALDVVRRIRPTVRAPLVLFTYANPVLRMGPEAFVTRASAAGLDGLLIVDLPVEERAILGGCISGAGIDSIFLVSPTTDEERMRRTAALGRGFLYGISRLGVTGARDSLAQDARELAARVRAITTLPLALGFGISRPEHVTEVGRYADAAVVGSALVDVIAEGGPTSALIERVTRYVRWLKGAEIQSAT